MPLRPVALLAILLLGGCAEARIRADCERRTSIVPVKVCVQIGMEAHERSMQQFIAEAQEEFRIRRSYRRW